MNVRYASIVVCFFEGFQNVGLFQPWKIASMGGRFSFSRGMNLVRAQARLTAGCSLLPPLSYPSPPLSHPMPGSYDWVNPDIPCDCHLLAYSVVRTPTVVLRWKIFISSLFCFCLVPSHFCSHIPTTLCICTLVCFYTIYSTYPDNVFCSYFVFPIICSFGFWWSPCHWYEAYHVHLIYFWESLGVIRFRYLFLFEMV